MRGERFLFDFVISTESLDEWRDLFLFLDFSTEFTLSGAEGLEITVSDIFVDAKAETFS